MDALLIGGGILVLGYILWSIRAAGSWTLVVEGDCLYISRETYLAWVTICPYTYDDLYRDCVETTIGFRGHKAVKLNDEHLDHPGPFPVRVRLERNGLGKHRLVDTAQQKAACHVIRE